MVPMRGFLGRGEDLGEEERKSSPFLIDEILTPIPFEPEFLNVFYRTCLTFRKCMIDLSAHISSFIELHTLADDRRND
jgi:hypothetical protein